MVELVHFTENRCYIKPTEHIQSSLSDHEKSKEKNKGILNKPNVF